MFSHTEGEWAQKVPLPLLKGEGAQNIRPVLRGWARKVLESGQGFDILYSLEENTRYENQKTIQTHNNRHDINRCKC